MLPEVTIILHDWEPSSEGQALVRNLNENPIGRDLRKIVVLRKRHVKDSLFLSESGVEVREISDGASPAEMKNKGLKGIDGSVLLLSSSVKIEDENLLKIMNEELERLGGEGVIGCKIMDEKGFILNAGYHVIQPECELLEEGSGKKDLNQFYYAREVEGVSSRCMLISKGLVKSLHFDEELSSPYDDIDFCLKAKSASIPVVCVGKIAVVASSEREDKSRESSRAELDRARDLYRHKWEEYYRNRYETRVMWHSWINAPTGYAVSSQHIVRALEALGVDVRYGFVYGVEEPPNEDERIMEVRRKPKDLSVTQVVYGQGDVFFKNSGKYKVGYSMLEVDGIPRDWVEQANAMDEVWVPSHFNKETFERSGVKRPIHVMPLGVDIDYFHPFIQSSPLGDRYVFLSVFEWGERKAPEILLKAYNQEFSSKDDVLLVLKVTNTDPAVNIERQVDDMRLIPDRAPIVMIINQNIPTDEMGGLYRSCDCFVLPTRGEGWGMPTLEAMACGLPVISTYWSAQTEFLNDDVAYPLKVKGLIPAVAKCPYYKGWKWADPDEEHLRTLMRRVYENREEARAKGLRASVWAREKWTWLHSASRIKKRLLEIS